MILIFCFNDTSPTEIYTLSLHDALPILPSSPFAAGMGLSHLALIASTTVGNTTFLYAANAGDPNGSISAFNVTPSGGLDRKSTRLNSSHLGISYAVFCLKKKKKQIISK